MYFPLSFMRHSRFFLIALLTVLFLRSSCHSSVSEAFVANFMDDTKVSLRIAPPSSGNLYFTMGVSIVDSPGHYHVLVHKNKMVLCEVYISVAVSNSTGTSSPSESLCKISPKELEEGDNSFHLMIYSTDTAQLVLTTTTHTFVPWGIFDSFANEQQSYYYDTSKKDSNYRDKWPEQPLLPLRSFAIGTAAAGSGGAVSYLLLQRLRPDILPILAAKGTVLADKFESMLKEAESKIQQQDGRVVESDDRLGDDSQHNQLHNGQSSSTGSLSSDSMSERGKSPFQECNKEKHYSIGSRQKKRKPRSSRSFFKGMGNAFGISAKQRSSYMQSARYSAMVLFGMVAGPAAVGRLFGTRIGALKVDTEPRYSSDSVEDNRDRYDGSMRRIVVGRATTAAVGNIIKLFGGVLQRIAATVTKNKAEPNVMIPVNMAVRYVMGILFGLIGMGTMDVSKIGGGVDSGLAPGIEPYFPQNTGLY